MLSYLRKIGKSGERPKCRTLLSLFYTVCPNLRVSGVLREKVLFLSSRVPTPQPVPFHLIVPVDGILHHRSMREALAVQDQRIREQSALDGNLPDHQRGLQGE